MKVFTALLLITCGVNASARTVDTLYIEKLEINRKKKEVFGGKDSSLVLRIDTLVMGDRSQLLFPGKKTVKLSVGHAEIGDRAYIFGNDGQNNGTDFEIDMRFGRLGALYVLAGGQDARNNGSRTFPNGNGGNVTFTYQRGNIVPQSEDRKAEHYLHVDTRAGGYQGNAQNELSNIYGLIRTGARGRPLSNLGQGQVYSGSPGRDGKSTVKAQE